MGTSTRLPVLTVVLFPEFVESDVILTSAKGFVGPHLADQTWALILGLLRGIGRAVRERTWENRMSIREETWELEGCTLGIGSDSAAQGLMSPNAHKALICA